MNRIGIGMPCASNSSTDVIDDVGEGIVENHGDDLYADVTEFVHEDIKEDSGVDVQEDIVGCYIQPKIIEEIIKTTCHIMTTLDYFIMTVHQLWTSHPSIS